MVQHPQPLTPLPYLFTLIFLLIAEVAYMLLARHFHIGQPVEPRSSHDKFTLTGGGIIFPLSMLLFAAFFHRQLSVEILLMLGGMCVLATVSFIDDVRALSPLIRLVVQITVIAIVYSQWCTTATSAIYLLLLLFGVGFINAFNFIDGINGIMSAYALVTLSTLYYAYTHVGIPPDSLLYQIVIFSTLAVIVFAIFNLRRTAVIFAGDVGSISLGFVILFLAWKLIAYTTDAVYLIFLMVCAVETVLTILGRLFEGANIFLPHRKFLFQMLVNEAGCPHYAIALSYAGIQLAINIGFFLMPPYMQWAYSIMVTIILVAAYFIIKSRIPRHHRHQKNTPTQIPR